MYAFYLSGMIRSLVLSLTGILGPIYVYTIGLREWGTVTHGILLVAAYYATVRLVALLWAIPASHVIEKIGFRRSITLSLVFVAINLALFSAREPGISEIILAAVMAGLNIPLYWVARNSAISQDATKSKIGTQMGWLVTFEQTATLLGPIVSGFVAEYWGFQTLFGSSLTLLFLSVIPLWYLPHHVHRNGVTLRGLWYFVTNHRYTHLAVGMGGKVIDNYTITIIWPLVIYLMNVKISMLGTIFTVVYVVSLAVRLMSGKLFDVLHKRHDLSDEIIYGVAAFGTSIFWMARLFVRSIGGVLWVDIPGTLFGTVYTGIYANYEQLGGMRMGSIAYFVYEEMIYSIMVIFLMGIVAIGAWYDVWKEMAFLTAAVWMIASTVMARESNLK